MDAGFGGAGGQVSCLYLNPTPNDVELEVTGTPDAGTPGENCPTTDTPPSDPAALLVYDLVEATQHARLQQFIGQYVCGTGWIYRGTFAAQDNLGSNPGDTNGFINSGPVIAAVATDWKTNEYSLNCTQRATGVRALLVIPTAQSNAIRLFQVLGGDGTTYSSIIRVPNNEGWAGVSGACDGCVADLRGVAPASLSIGPVTLTGAYCGAGTLEVASCSTSVHDSGGQRSSGGCAPWHLDPHPAALGRGKSSAVSTRILGPVLAVQPGGAAGRRPGS